MTRVLAAYYNPSGETDEGVPSRREKLWLSEADLLSHIHGVGSTRSGKSKWLEWFCRQLYRENLGFTLLDPQGKLSADLLGWLAVENARRVVYFDPNRSDYLVPFNPFRALQGDPAADPNYLTRVAVRAKEQAAATLRVWGMENAESTPRLKRWLYCLYYLFARGLVTFSEAGTLLSLRGSALRAEVALRLEGESGVADEWHDLNRLAEKRPSDFYGQIESTKNRLFDFINQPQIKRLFASDEGLDFDEAFRTHAIVICNLKPGDALHEDDTSMVGSLMVYELWKSVERYLESPSGRPYYLLIDEVQKFVTPDLKEILDRGAGKGLRLGVFHQHLTQLRDQDERTYASITTNAKIKLAFGGLSYQDARLMVDEMFSGQIDLAEVKSVIEQTKFWPTYDRDTVRSKARGSASAAGTSLGIREESQQGNDSGDSTKIGISRNESLINTESSMEGEADIPIYRPVPYREVTSVEHYSLEEQKERLAGALKRQYQRHLFVQVPGRDTLPALTPYVQDRHLAAKNEARVIRDEFIKPYARAVAELDQRLKKKEPEKAPEAETAPWYTG